MDDDHFYLDNLPEGETVDVYVGVEDENGDQIGRRLAAVVDVRHHLMHFTSEPFTDEVLRPCDVRIYHHALGGAALVSFPFPDGITAGSRLVATIPKSPQKR